MRNYQFGLLVAVYVLLPGSECANWWSEMISKGTSPWAKSRAAPEERALDMKVNDGPCECVFFYQCDPETRRIITTGAGIVRWRVGESSDSEDCADPTQICCKPPLPDDEQSDQPPPVFEPQEEPGPPQVPQVFNPPETPTAPVIKNPTDESLTLNTGSENETPEETELSCGERKISVDWRTSIRVSGGDEDTQTVFGEFPWMVMVQHVVRDTTDLVIFLCGGSLIHPRVILTAAHSVNNKDPATLQIRAGEWDVAAEDEPLVHQDRLVQAIVIHPWFRESKPQHDIALLFIKDPFVITNNVNTICLPEENVDYTSSRCFGTGWGLDKDDESGKSQNILRKAELPVVGKSECQDLLRKTRLGKYFKLHKSFLCAGGESNLDLCVGDGGGPLACPAVQTQDRFVQVGVTSWGVGCGEKDVPGVYTDVAAHFDWIIETIRTRI